MNPEQFLKGIYILEEFFTGFLVSDNEKRLEIWYKMFKDDSPEVFENACLRLASTSKFAPTVAALRECMQEITNPSAEITADDAWKEVQDCIRHCGSYNETSASNSMTPITKKIVQAMGYRNLCLSETQMADRAHFMKMFEQYKEREKRDYLLPSGVKSDSLALRDTAIKMLSNSFSMPTVKGDFGRTEIDPSLRKFDDRTGDDDEFEDYDSQEETE